MTLRIEKLRKSFKDVHALKSLDFELPSGGAIALLGPNGAGKSTAVKIMTTLVKPDEGRFLCDGRDLFASPAEIRRLVGYVSQEMAMDKQLTGVEFMRFCAGILHLSWKDHGQRALALLDQMGLSEAGSRLVGTYSGGMKRRLDLACALLHDPKVLILDEPTSGLDLEAREKIWELIRGFTGKGGSLILASHDFREVDELAREILILDKGQVILRGTPDHLRAQLGRFIVRVKTRAYMGEADIQAVTKALADLALEPCADERHAAFIYRGEASMHGLQDRIHGALGQAGLPVFSLFVQQPDLEDVYRFATGDRT